MASAIAFQAWLYVAKPWGRTPWPRDADQRRAKLEAAPNWVFTAAVFAPLIDIAVGARLGFPAPAVSLLTLTGWLLVRRRTPPTPPSRPALARFNQR